MKTINPRRPALTVKRMSGLISLARFAEASIQAVEEGGDGDIVRGGKVLPDVDAALDYIRELNEWFGTDGHL